MLIVKVIFSFTCGLLDTLDNIALLVLLKGMNQ